MLKQDCRTRATELDAALYKLIQQETQLKKISGENKYLEELREQCLQQLNQLQSDLAECTQEEIDAESQLDNKGLESRYRELEKINVNLSDKIKNLKIEIKKRDSIIEIQEDVIRLLDDTKKTIETSLKEQIAKKLFEIETMENRLRMVIQDTILFNASSMMINTHGKRVLNKIAASVIEKPDQHIRVEGHTDNRPPKKTYSNNWELSAARAITVIRFLETAGLDPAKLSAVAYGATRPVASNDTEEGRLLNRRIELVLYYSN